MKKAPEQYSDNVVRFEPQPDQFDGHTLRLCGTEYIHNYDYKFISSLSLRTEWREQLATIMQSLRILVAQNGVSEVQNFMPKVSSLLETWVLALDPESKNQEIVNEEGTVKKISDRLLLDFLLNTFNDPKDLFGRMVYDYFGFDIEDSLLTTKSQDNLKATLLCRNPYILSVSGIGDCMQEDDLENLKQEILTTGRTCRDVGLRKTGRMINVEDNEGFDIKIGKEFISRFPEMIRQDDKRQLSVTSGYYMQPTEDYKNQRDCSLAAHSDTLYAPFSWKAEIINRVRARKDFGCIPPLSFASSDRVSFSTLLYYPCHPEEGFEFALPTLADPNNPTKSLEICPKPHDVLVMDNVKTFPFASTQDIMLPATAAIHEVKHGTGEKAFVALFVNA